jgi:2-iminobutanoate/2-iminopropanoate deaminase
MDGARRELRVAGQAEPISHFTDAVEAGGFLFVSGIVPVDEQRELVGGDDVVAQARCVSRTCGRSWRQAAAPSPTSSR